MSKAGGPHAGVYVVHHLTGFEVGESTDVFMRNFEYTWMGVPWTVARPMPGSRRPDRVREETAVADFLCSQGYTVLTRNTSAHRVKKRSDQHQAKLAEAHRGKKLSFEHREKITASLLRYYHRS